MPTKMAITSSSNTPLSAKRNASTAGLNNPSGRPAKRRASKACACCRARKVRCNVVEHGAPCTNCRLDEVECIVQDSKRRKYVLPLLTIAFFDLHSDRASAVIYVSLLSEATDACNLRLVHRKFWDKFDNTQPPSSSPIHAEIREAAEAIRNDGVKLATNSNILPGGGPECHSPLSSSCRSHDSSERDHEQHVPHMICELQSWCYSTVPGADVVDWQIKPKATDSVYTSATDELH